MREMKDSGVPEIGTISNSCHVERLKFLLSDENNNLRVGPFGSALPSSDFIDDGYWVYNQRVVLDENYCTNNTCVNNDTFSRLSGFQVYPGDILITTRGTIGKVSIVPQNAPKGILHPCIIRFRINADALNKEFLKYYINDTDVLLTQIKRISGSTTIEALYSYNLKEFNIVIPPIDEQTEIVGFLNKACAQIDEAITRHKAIIEKLQEYRKAVITQAVTKGLDPDVEMKDSNMDWLSKIPSEWQEYRAKYVFKERRDRGNHIELQLLSPTQKYGVIPQKMYEELSGMKAVKLKEETDFNQLKTVHPDDYCISLRSFQGGFEFSRYEGVVSPAYHIFYAQMDIDTGYYRYLFKERNFIHKINYNAQSLRDGKPITFDDFGEVYIPYPPISEQAVIAKYLDDICANIDDSIARHKAIIEKLQEYRKSVIYNAVTGKIDCRESL